MREKIKIQEASSTCWCEYCKVNIPKGTRYLQNLKRATRGTARVNICLSCIRELNSQFTKEDNIECDLIKIRLLAKAVSE
jgi:hypothetical protein